MNPTSSCPVHLPSLSLPAKLMLTLFLFLMGTGVLVSLANIYFHHHDADLDPALTTDDIRRVFHGMNKTVTTQQGTVKPSEMLKEVSPGGKMRKHLEAGGPAAVRSLVAWLETGAKEADFSVSDKPQTGDPSPQTVIGQCCVRCHNAKDGDESDIPYAPDSATAPQFALVAKLATPMIGPTVAKTETIYLAPTATNELVQITHAHILVIPVFTLIVGGLFLLTGLPAGIKLILGPLPMLAVCMDIGGWWLARPFEPAIYLIAAAGAILAAGLGAQILCVLGSMWFGARRPA